MFIIPQKIKNRNPLYQNCGFSCLEGRIRTHALQAAQKEFGIAEFFYESALALRFPPVKKDTRWVSFFTGGEGEIRTLEPLLTVTRFPVVRPRPTRRLLQIFNLSRGDSYIISQACAFVNTFFYFFVIFHRFSGSKNAATATGVWECSLPQAAAVRHFLDFHSIYKAGS